MTKRTPVYLDEPDTPEHTYTRAEVYATRAATPPAPAPPAPPAEEPDYSPVDGRYPLAPLRAQFRSWADLGAAVGKRADTVRRASYRGLSPAQADEWAMAAGYFPHELWPTWWADAPDDPRTDDEVRAEAAFRAKRAEDDRRWRRRAELKRDGLAA